MKINNHFFYGFILVVCTFSQIGCSNESDIPPKDEELIKNFKINKPTYEKFITIFMKNKGLTRISAPPKGLSVPAPLSVDIDDVSNLNQVEIIADMNNKLHVSVVDVNSRKNESMRYEVNADLGPVNEISFYSFRSGIVSSGGKLKGISYFAYEPPKVLEDSLDKFDPPQNKPFPITDKPSVRVYSKIEDKWYLFVEEWR